MLLSLALLGCLASFPDRAFVEDPTHDFDGDGVTESGGDCDDAAPGTAPGFAETCDGRDNDCDGETDEIADDDGVAVVDAPRWYGDEDADGYGIDSYVVVACAQPAGFAAQSGDCDDGSPTIRPGATEVCGGRDDDCDGMIDEAGEGGVVDEKTWYLDGDRDGWGTPDTTYVGCEPPNGYAYDAGDCDDLERAVYPGAPEVCDGQDNDCDGLSDDADEGTTGLATWFADSDGDGWGTDATTAEACEAPEGYSADDGDCDDADPRVAPYAAETCNDADDDCDGRADEGVQLDVFRDADGDGFGDPAALSVACAPSAGWVVDFRDCDDSEAAVNPDAGERCATPGTDDDCDGRSDEEDAVDATTWHLDADGDGHGDPDATVAGCAAPLGYVAAGDDCEDGRANVNPGAAETCLTVYDDDCDGGANDPGATGCRTFYRDGDADGFGPADDAACTCTADTATGYVASLAGDCDDANPLASPGLPEACTTGFDDDCDGETNDLGAGGCTLYFWDEDGDGFGVADASQCSCVADGGFSATADGDCDEADPVVNPAGVETCGDAIDNDCSGDADGGDAIDARTWYLDADADGYGLTGYTRSACEAPSGYATVGADCDDTRGGLNPGMDEDCLTTFDDDCSGSTNDVGADSCTTFYADADSDGYGIASDRNCTCVADTTTVYTSRVTGDCLDTDAGVSPGDTELCSTVGVDDDCDGATDEENASGCTNYFYDYDGDGYGTSTSRCLCSTSGYYTAATLGDCDDTDAGTSPAALNCGLLGTVSTSSAAAVITGGGGGNIATMDYNRDGWQDVAVGASGEDNDYVDAGAVYLWLGSSVGFTGSHAATSSGDADLRFVGGGYAARCGAGISGGDTDFDGYDELLVECYAGSWHYAIDDGRDGLGTLRSGDVGVTAGSGRVAQMIGDLDGDGAADAMVSNGYATTRTTYTESFVVFQPGSAFERTGPIAYSTPFFNMQVSMWGGDLDGDGDDEVIENSMYGVSVSHLEGGALIGDQTLHGDVWVARAVRNAADVDSDGYTDMLVGVSSYSDRVDPYAGPISNGGVMSIFRGGYGMIVTPSGASATSLDDDFGWRMEGGSAIRLGANGRNVGDLDGDGMEDLAFGSGTGALMIKYGPFDLGGGTYVHTESDAFLSLGGSGVVVEPAGDVNADGYDDLWAGGSSLYLFHGTPR